VLAILDVNVFVSAVVTPNGPADRLVSAAKAGTLDLIVSSLLLDELRSVLHRSKFRRRVSVREADEFIEAVRQMARLHPDREPRSPYVRDPDDDYLVELARTSGADVLVSGDKDLLAVDARIVRVLTPREAADEVGAGPVRARSC
jgi:uncharacterized protein